MNEKKKKKKNFFTRIILFYVFDINQFFLFQYHIYANKDKLYRFVRIREREKKTRSSSLYILFHENDYVYLQCVHRSVTVRLFAGMLSVFLNPIFYLSFVICRTLEPREIELLHFDWLTTCQQNYMIGYPRWVSPNSLGIYYISM